MDGRELLKRYDAYKEEALFLRDENRFLRGERDHYRRQWFFTQERLNQARGPQKRAPQKGHKPFIDLTPNDVFYGNLMKKAYDPCFVPVNSS